MSNGFPRGNLEYVTWMTREEFEVVFALTFAMQVSGEIPGTSSFDSMYRYVITSLQRDYGHTWEGLHVSDDGELYPTQDEPLERRNVLFINMIRMGRALDYERTLSVCLSWLREHVQGFPRELMKEAISKVRQDRERLKEIEVPKEVQDEWFRRYQIQQEGLRAMQRLEEELE